MARLSAAVSAIPEFITEGETGLLVPPGDPDALAAGLVTLSTDGALRERLATACSARVHATFNTDASIDAIAAALLDPETLQTRAAA